MGLPRSPLPLFIAPSDTTVSWKFVPFSYCFPNLKSYLFYQTALGLNKTWPAHPPTGIENINLSTEVDSLLYLGQRICLFHLFLSCNLYFFIAWDSEMSLLVQMTLQESASLFPVSSTVTQLRSLWLWWHTDCCSPFTYLVRTVLCRHWGCTDVPSVGISFFIWQYLPTCYQEAPYCKYNKLVGWASFL